MAMSAMHVRGMGVAMIGNDVRMRAVERNQHQADVRQQADQNKQFAHDPESNQTSPSRTIRAGIDRQWIAPSP